MAIQQLGDNRPDGMNWGASATEKISFYGSGTTRARRSGSSQAAVTDSTATVTAAVSQNGAWALSTNLALTTLINQVSSNTTLLNEIRAALDSSTGLNLIKGSA